MIRTFAEELAYLGFSGGDNMALSKTGCSRTITKTDLDAAYMGSAIGSTVRRKCSICKGK